MCGIVGTIGGNLDLNAEWVPKMMETIAHRGPDGSGIFKSEKHNIVFGHQRLAIIDIESGDQPMQCANDRYTIVFNGEIYNFLELRQSLYQKGVSFKTHSDTEVLLNMYAEYGKQMLQYINGMFAFALYDKAKNEVFIARDQFGIKPLYYSIVEGSFIFGSEVKALLCHPKVKASTDYKSIHEYLTFQFVLGKHTLFENIFKLEPASYLVVSNGEIKEKKEYWHPSFEVNTSKSKEEYTSELLLLLQNSMSIQIRSDVPVGAYLSGGIDSSLVSMLASGYYQGKFNTFTGGFKESKEYDESGYAKLVSDKIQSNHFEIFPSSDDFISVLHKIVYHMDEPAGGPGVFPQYMVSKLAKEHVKVVLGGQGGDEIFGGYTRYAVAYLEQCIKGAIFETQEEGSHIVTLNSIIQSLPSLKNYVPLIKKQFSSGLFGDMDERYFHLIDRSPNVNSLYSEALLKERDKSEIFAKFQKIFNRSETPSYFNKMTYFDMKTLLPALLQVEDRVSMSVSLESRVPILDKRIVELAGQIPPTLKFSGGKTKHMLIEAVKNILPKEIVERKDKMGFPTPLNEWLSGPLKDFVLDTFNSTSAKSRGYYNLNNIEKKLKDDAKFDRELWGALNIELWCQKFIDN